MTRALHSGLGANTASSTRQRRINALPQPYDLFSLESALLHSLEAMMVPRLENLSQSIRDLAVNDGRFDHWTTNYRLPTVLKRVGVSKSTWYAWSNPKSASYDPTIPQGIKLGDHPRSPVVWRKREIEAWIDARAAATRARVNGGVA